MNQWATALGFKVLLPGQGITEPVRTLVRAISERSSWALIGRRIVMLHSFVEKSQKTPVREIDIAWRRMLEVKRANP